MRVLVACEFSGIVREAFLAKGHLAYSCDLLDTEIPSSYHFIGDALEVIKKVKPDLLIAHPPCTYLCNSSVRWLYEEDGRVEKMDEAADFFSAFLDANVEKICIENPIMHKFAFEAIGSRKYSQIINPWEFGHGETKQTCLWLKNLPLLKSTNIVEGREPKVHHARPGKNRWKERSRTYTGIAKAMAEQWG